MTCRIKYSYLITFIWLFNTYITYKGLCSYCLSHCIYTYAVIIYVVIICISCIALIICYRISVTICWLASTFNDYLNFLILIRSNIYIGIISQHNIMAGNICPAISYRLTFSSSLCLSLANHQAPIVPDSAKYIVNNIGPIILISIYR